MRMVGLLALAMLGFVGMAACALAGVFAVTHWASGGTMGAHAVAATLAGMAAFGCIGVRASNRLDRIA